MSLIFKYLKKYKKESIIAPLFKLLEACFDLLVPFIVASIIDIGIKNGDTGYVIKMCLILLLLAVVGLSCTLVAQYYAARAAAGTGAGLRSELFSHIQMLTHKKTDEIGNEKLLTAMSSDINQVQSGVNMTLRLLLRSPIIVIGASMMAFIISPRQALIFAVIIPILFVIVFGIMLSSIPLFKKVQSKLDSLTGKTRSNIKGTRVIRAFRREEQEKKEFDERNSAHSKILTFSGRITALTNPVTYCIINFGIIALIYFGGYRVYDGDITQGELIALYNLMSQILVELIKLANTIFLVTRAIACSKRIEAILETETGMDTSLQDSKISPELESDAVYFDNVSIAYSKGAEESLTGISFSVKSGETVGIIGGTGSGKSTLVNLIPRFYDATNGAVFVFGRNVKEYPADTLRELMGIVPQKAVLFKGSVRSNLLWGNEMADDEAMTDALKLSGAYDFVMKKDGGLDAPVNQNGSNFSGGQRQRLTIARALVRKPKILILDDSASALDYQTEAELRKNIKELDFKPTVFIISQRTSSIMHADKILVLDDGELVGMGKHDELLSSSEVYREIHFSQYKQDDNKSGGDAK